MCQFWLLGSGDLRHLNFRNCDFGFRNLLNENNHNYKTGINMQIKPHNLDCLKEKKLLNL